MATSGATRIVNVDILERWGPGGGVQRGEVLIEGGVVTAVTPARHDSDLTRPSPGRGEAATTAAPSRDGERVVDGRGGLLAPGLVVGHTHLYSALARGMALPGEPPRGFLDILAKVWWRLDRALNADANRASAVAGCFDALGAGVVGLIDHHASPNAIDGSLELLATESERLGVRLCACYETSCRDGDAVRDAGLRENRRFAASVRGSRWHAAMIGAHASFTLDDATLDALAEACASSGVGLHVHLAEGGDDRRQTRLRFGRDLLDGFASRGLLGPQTLLAHAIDVSDDDLARIAEAGASVVHNPASNLNNRVGFRPAWRDARADGGGVLLGTDGIGADLFEGCRVAYFRGREADEGTSTAAMRAMLQANADALYGRLGVVGGVVAPGAVADLVLLRYQPPTPLHSHNVDGHLLFGMSAAHVEQVWTDGVSRWNLGEPVGVDVEAELADCQRAAAALWRRAAAL